MRTSPRKRRPLGAAGRFLLSPLLRYSSGRDAYVLRGIGAQLGPVFVDKPKGHQPSGDPPAPPRAD